MIEYCYRQPGFIVYFTDIDFDRLFKGMVHLYYRPTGRGEAIMCLSNFEFDITAVTVCRELAA